MRGLLVKKQLMEIFRSYFYNAKKNTGRSKAATILMFLLFAVLMFGILGGMFSFLSLTLCAPLAEAGMGWLYYVIMGLLAVLLGVFGSVFSTYSGLYLAKDNDLLLSMPVPVSAILSARLLSVYLMGLLYTIVVSLPAVIVYWTTVRLSAASVLGGLLWILLISVFVLVLSCVLGWVVAKISLRLKNKSFVTVLLSLLFIAAYYFFYFKAQTLLRDLIANAGVYGERIRGAAYGLYLSGRAAEGDWTAMLLLAAAVGLLYFLTRLVLSRSFLGIVTSTGAVSRTEYREKRANQKSASRALLGKELGRFTSSPNYMLNCGLSTLLLPLCGILLLWKGALATETLDEVFGARPGSVTVLFCAALCMLASMNDMATPSVSLEGSSFWITRSLPVTPWQILRAKLSLQLLLTALPMLFCSLCAVVALRAKLLESLLVLLLPLLYCLLSACLHLILGVSRADLQWTNELAPIKQSLAVLLALLFGWIYAAALGILYFLAGWRIGAVPYLGLAALLTGIVGLLLFLWLKKRGTAALEAL